MRACEDVLLCWEWEWEVGVRLEVGGSWDMCTPLGTMPPASVKCYQNVDVDIDVDVAGDHSHNARNARHLIHQIPHTSSLTMAMSIPPNLTQICPHIHPPPLTSLTLSS